jgi:23S rRNA pseudouridine2605 synthase
MPEERLQKLLARAGIASRRKAEKLIREGRVTVNGAVAGIGDKADPERDAVKVDGKRVQPQEVHLYLLLNKPRAVMSTVSDPEGRPTVIELVPEAMRKALVPVGRLDFLTEGLLLLTDDGDFAQRIAHPRHGCWKTYEVKVSGHPEEATLAKLREGVVIDGQRTAPCRIEPRPMHGGRAGEGENSWWVVQLSEGRTRQIREMFERAGHPVQKLRRVAIGPLSDSELPLGAVRELTEREVEMLKKAAGKPPREAAAAGKPGEKGGAGKKPRRRRRGAAEGKMPPGEKEEPREAHRGRRGAEWSGGGRGIAPKRHGGARERVPERPELIGLPVVEEEEFEERPPGEIPAHERKPFGRGPRSADEERRLGGGVAPPAARGVGYARRGPRNPTPAGRGTRPGAHRPAHPRTDAPGGYYGGREGARGGQGGPRQPAPGFRGARHGGPHPGHPGGTAHGPRRPPGGGRRPPRGGGSHGPRRGNR